MPPRLLTIAGSDSGGGAGIQADLKTFAAFCGYGMSAVTAVTAQNTLGVSAIHPVPPEVVEAQIGAVAEDLGLDAVKIGMLASAPLVHAVALALRRWARDVPVVLDPVMVAKSGHALLADDAVQALVEELLPLATVVTPNLPEAARLTGLPVATTEEREVAARALGKLAGGGAVLVKGGHGEGQVVKDLLLEGGPGGRLHRFHHRRLDTTSTHGTGCTLSSAIAAGLGAGLGLAPAVEQAVTYLQRALAAAYPLGAGHGPVNHLHQHCHP